MKNKPSSCFGCSLYDQGLGFGEAVGPIDAPILFVGEALGKEEAAKGEPFVGASGALLNKVLNYCGIKREEVRIHNIVNCQPPNNYLVGAPWMDSSIRHCSQYLNKTLEEPHKVIVALGATAAKQLTGLFGQKGVKVEDLHGAPIMDVSGRFWVIPTYHPSFVLQGNGRFIGVLIHDILKAKEIAEKGRTPDNPRLLVDPPWFEFDTWARYVMQKAETSQNGLWLAADIETPKKQKEDEDKLEGSNLLPEEDEEVSDDEAPTPKEVDEIKRINFASELDVNLGITVPWNSQYLPTIIKLLLHPKLKKAFWNMIFDVTKIKEAGVEVAEPAYDFMYGFHILQSDIRMSLGFTAPFYSDYGPWKHLTDHKKPFDRFTAEDFDNFGKYAALDAVQTIRCVLGIARDLKKLGGWYAFERHIKDIDRFCFRPAEKVGLKVDRQALVEFELELKALEQIRVDRCIANAPQEIVPYENTWKTDRAAKDENGNLLPGCKEVRITDLVYKCGSCGKIDVPKTHNKTKKCLDASMSMEEMESVRWVKEGTFNPASPQQVLAYIKWRGHQPGRAKKSKAESSDAAALEKLAAKHPKDPVYGTLLELRKISKMRGTYATGTRKKLDENDRLHSEFTHKPSTLRSSSRKPNLQNVVGSKAEDEFEFGKKFRKCIVADVGCTFIETDFSAIEAVTTGWCARDKDYIRLAKLGIHDYLTSILVNDPTDLAWDDETILAHHARVKKEHKFLRERAKRTVHGSSYGLTALGLHLTYPEDFPKVKDAEAVQKVLFEVAAPKVREWQIATIKKADERHFLGGTDHPFGYRHWFWNVINYTKIPYDQAMKRKAKGAQIKTNSKGDWWEVKHGDDAKRAIAFFPQSIAGGILKEAMLLMFDPDSPYYIGDTYYGGQTPLRMPIHDAVLLEVPDEKIYYVLERMLLAMRSPIKQLPLDPDWGMGEFIKIGTETEMGKVWSEMKKVKT